MLVSRWQHTHVIARQVVYWVYTLVDFSPEAVLEGLLGLLQLLLVLEAIQVSENPHHFGKSMHLQHTCNMSDQTHMYHTHMCQTHMQIVRPTDAGPKCISDNTHHLCTASSCEY